MTPDILESTRLITDRNLDLVPANEQIVSGQSIRSPLNLLPPASRGRFFAAFSYGYFLRSKGLLDELAVRTNWAFRDESTHTSFAFDLIDAIGQEQ